MSPGVQRGAFVGKRAPGPFHCLGCQTYVTGTESGHCPKCGWVPPSAGVVAPAMASNGRVVVLAAVLVLLAVAYVLVH